ncbi:hypothetical protein RJ640_012766, partial [Escallonia rubra]
MEVGIGVVVPKSVGGSVAEVGCDARVVKIVGKISKAFDRVISMGIQGLLPLLKSIMAPIHIKDIQGCSVAVDTYSWLHKGALSCSKDLCKGNPTS